MVFQGSVEDATNLLRYFTLSCPFDIPDMISHKPTHYLLSWDQWKDREIRANVLSSPK